jgi:APA family basic amino acid/polyamine antiporter
VLKFIHQPQAAFWLTVAVMVAIPTVILVLLYGQSRIFFAMARDGLLPAAVARVNPKTKTPVLMTLIVGVAVSLIAGLFNLDQIAEMANAGTLIAFIGVAGSVIVLRLRQPNRERIFKTPLWWLVAPFCVIGCAYLFGAGLTMKTKTLCLYWGAIGLVIYLTYGAWRSKLAKAGE